jgi:thioester reductase-like protein
MLYSGPSLPPSIGDTDGQPLVPEAPIEDSSMTLPQGYTQSKYIAERIIVEAVKAGSGLRATVCRVGQLCGSTETGAWPSYEYTPRILRSVMLLGVAPDTFPVSDLLVISDCRILRLAS